MNFWTLLFMLLQPDNNPVKQIRWVLLALFYWWGNWDSFLSRGIRIRCHVMRWSAHPCQVKFSPAATAGFEILHVLLIWWDGKSDAWHLILFCTGLLHELSLLNIALYSLLLTSFPVGMLILVFYDAHCNRSCPRVGERAAVSYCPASHWVVHLIRGRGGWSINTFPVFGTSLNLISLKKGNLSIT